MQRQTMIINDITISYVHEQKPEQDTVLFLHGFQASLNSFGKLFARPRDFNVVAFDFPSHGQSGPCLDLTLSLLVDITTTFLQRLNLQGIKIVGHSLGGAVALMVKGNYHKILAAPHNPFIFEFQDQTLLGTMISPQSLADAKLALRNLVSPSFANKFYFTHLTTSAQHFLDHYRHHQASYDHLISTHILNDAPSYLARIKADILTINQHTTLHLITGQDDRYVPVQATTALAHFLKSDIIKLPRVGHSPFFETDDGLAHLIRTIKKT